MTKAFLDLHLGCCDQNEAQAEGREVRRDGTNLVAGAEVSQAISTPFTLSTSHTKEC
jgi:hypothetical protein